MLSHLVYVVAKNIVTVQPSLTLGCAECAHIFIHSFIQFNHGNLFSIFPFPKKGAFY